MEERVARQEVAEWSEIWRELMWEKGVDRDTGEGNVDKNDK